MAIAPAALARKRIVGPAWAAAFGLCMLALSTQIKDPGTTVFGPRFWPMLIGALLIVINTYALIRALFAVPETGDSAAPTPSPKLLTATTWLPATLVVSFPLLVYICGFLVGSALFLAVFMRSLGYRSWVVIGLTSLAFSLFVNYFFTSVAYTPLPRGIGPFYDVSAEFSRVVTAK